MKAAAQRETTASREAFRIKSADHTGFTVSSLDDALAFWVDVLGFEHLYTWTFERGRSLSSWWVSQVRPRASRWSRVPTT